MNETAMRRKTAGVFVRLYAAECACDPPDLAAESVMYEHHRAMFRVSLGAYLLAILLSPIGIGLVWLLCWYIAARCETLKIENGRVTYKRGVFSRDHVELFIANIRSVRVDQTIWQRLFGVGTIQITSSGSSPEIIARGMPEAKRARELLSP